VFCQWGGDFLGVEVGYEAIAYKGIILIVEIL